MKFYRRSAKRQPHDLSAVVDWLSVNIGEMQFNNYFMNNRSYFADDNTLPNPEEKEFDDVYQAYHDLKSSGEEVIWSKRYINTFIKATGDGWSLLAAIHSFDINWWAEDLIVEIEDDTLAIQFKLADIL